MDFWLKKPSHRKPFCVWKNKYKAWTAFTLELTFFSLYLLILIHYLMVAEENGSSLQWFHFFDGIFLGRWYPKAHGILKVCSGLGGRTADGDHEIGYFCWWRYSLLSWAFWRLWVREPQTPDHPPQSTVCSENRKNSVNLPLDCAL